MAHTPGQGFGLILMDGDRIRRTLDRMACQIMEDTPDTGELTLLGIDERGYHLARQLAKSLEVQSGNPIRVFRIVVRNNSSREDELGQIGDRSGKLILVDDVLFSGSTLMKAIRGILEKMTPQSLQICVLVDRGHHNFPLTARYTGLNSPTKLAEHVAVSFGTNGHADTVILTKS
jgi:pyrimidine operon attenuation protein / uracil phosphoribosyltransferase